MKSTGFGLVRVMLFLFQALVLPGCAYVTVQAPQLSAVKRLLASESAVDFGPFTWALRWAGAEQPVIPVSVANQFVFTHASGVEVTFDGWNITRVAGLLGREPITMRLDDSQVLRIQQGVQAVYEGVCMPWAKDEAGYVQRCEGLDPRRIELDEVGNIQALSFIIHPDYPALLLRR